MKRRSEHLVEKRDGRTEFLRATKLARSVQQALQSVGVDEDWRALEVTAAVLAGLRRRRELQQQDGGAPQRALSTRELADAVQHVLVATGHPAAAVAFGAVSAERSRRRAALALAGREVAIAEGPALAVDTTQAGRRLPLE
jgi:hypothetical protein